MNTYSQQLVRYLMASHLGNREVPIEDATTFDQLQLALDRALVALRIEDFTGADGHLFIHALDHSKTVGDLAALVDQSALPSPAGQPNVRADRQDYAVNSEQAEVEPRKPPQLSVRLVSPQRRSSAPQLSRAP